MTDEQFASLARTLADGTARMSIGVDALTLTTQLLTAAVQELRVALLRLQDLHHNHEARLTAVEAVSGIRERDTQPEIPGLPEDDA